MFDFKELQSIDLKLHLLSGSSIRVGNLTIKPYTLREIRDYGYINYMTNLQLLSIPLEDFLSSIDDMEKRIILEEQKSKLKAFDFYIDFGNAKISNELINALKMILRTDDVRLLDKAIVVNFVKIGILELDENNDLIVNEEVLNSVNDEELMIINRENFDEIVEVVKLQNYLTKPMEIDRDEVYANEETRKLAEDMKRHRKRVEEKKKAQKESDGGDDIDIADIISSVSSKSNTINRFNIWRFTLYQIYDEYSRLELIDNYEFSIKAMMAGAEKIDLRHWSSKI